MGKKLIHSKVTEQVDAQTGEILSFESQKVFSEPVDSEHFYMVFFDNFYPVSKLTSKGARDLLDWMCANAEFNTGIVKFPTPTRKQVCELLQINSAQCSKYLKILLDANLITGETGLYKVNPLIFWKGDQKIRKESLKNKDLRITYEIVNSDENNG